MNRFISDACSNYSADLISVKRELMLNNLAIQVGPPACHTVEVAGVSVAKSSLYAPCRKALKPICSATANIGTFWDTVDSIDSQDIKSFGFFQVSKIFMRLSIFKFSERQNS
jgi:hypothetical protein